MKFEPKWDLGMKVCSNDPGHVTKMAAMLIHVYSKNPLKIFFSVSSKLMTFELDIQHRGLALQSLFK